MISHRRLGISKDTDITALVSLHYASEFLLFVVISRKVGHVAKSTKTYTNQYVAETR